MNHENAFSNNVLEHFTEDVLTFIRKEISTYLGQEILFAGHINSENKIDSCDIIAKGNENQAPVIFKRGMHYDVIVHNHPSSYLEPSDADLNIAGLFSDFEIAFFIINNNADKVNVVVPLTQKIVDKQISSKEVLDTFKLDGLLSQFVEKFEPRKPQEDMVKRVVEAFNENKVFICEAATGTGKSIAYLMVACIWAGINRKKVIVSTNTIHLQEQLLKKDLPVVQNCIKKILGKELNVVLVKGKNNYLCQRKFKDFKKEYEKKPEKWWKKINADHIDEVLNWGEQTLTGDKNELSYLPKYDLWDELSCENDTCKRKQCRYEKICFQHKLKKNIFKADLLIVNHHILCADLSIKKETSSMSAGLLPPFERLIIDEAHQLEDVATIYFGSQASTREIKRTLSLIGKKDIKTHLVQSGVLKKILDKIQIISNPAIQDKEGKEKNEKILIELYEKIDFFFQSTNNYEVENIVHYETLWDYFNHAEEGFFNSNDVKKKKEYKHRFHKDEFQNPHWQKNYRDPLQKILNLLHLIHNSLSEINKLLEDSFLDAFDIALEKTDFKAYQERLFTAIDTFSLSLEKSKDNTVHWIHVSRLKKNIYFSTHVSPLDLGEVLRDHLFNPMKTVVLSSATLATNNDFIHLKERWGLFRLSKDRVIEEQLSSSFDYKKNCLMIIPTLFPTVTQNNFIDKTCEYLLGLLELFRGQMVWLFTSYAMMLKVHQELFSSAQSLGITLLLQGNEPRHDLLTKIKSQRNGVLMGVSSFWEGIDIKGEQLTCLVMIKLPFAMPNDPILQARLEKIEERGSNSFMTYTLPQAILRFKQGFGRLIRSQEDKGVFVLLDNRVLSKSYGKMFLNSLPPGIRQSNQSPQIVVEKYFSELLN